MRWDKDQDRTIQSSLKKREPCEETAAEEARKSPKGSTAEESPKWRALQRKIKKGLEGALQRRALRGMF